MIIQKRTILSLAILTKNDEDRIEELIKQMSFADEIVVVDDESNDRTAKIAEKSGATVYIKKLNGDFARQRNFAMEHAQGEWIMFVDTDEVMSNNLKQEIKKIVNLNERHNDFAAYYIKRRDMWWGRELVHGELAPAASKGIIRLVKKGSGQWFGKVHEVFVTNQKTAMLKNHLQHFPHPDIASFLKDINIYSTLRADELKSNGVNSSVWQIILYPAGKFVNTYLFRLGILDGVGGFVYSFMMSFHSFLVRAKLYLLQVKRPA